MRYPSRSAASSTRARVSSLAPARSLITFDTVIFDTPAARATSRIVTMPCLVVTTPSIMPRVGTDCTDSGSSARSRGERTPSHEEAPLQPASGAVSVHPAVPADSRRLLAPAGGQVGGDELPGGPVRPRDVHRHDQLR